jgi:1-pyrroline-5-carboxylate dehydrogenase
MAQRVTYSSAASDPGLDEAFEAELERARAAVPDPLPHGIAGDYVSTGHVVERRDPSRSGEVIARFHEADSSTIERAVAAAHGAKADWRRMPTRERVACLRKAQTELAERQTEIAALVSAETGKNRLEAVAEAAEAVDLIDTYAGQLEEQGGFRTEMGTLSEAESNTDLLRPYGVFGVISPFNFPVALSVNMTSAALLAGNTVVLKPSDKTPRSGSLVYEVLARHLPNSVLNLVLGGAATGEALTKADVDGIAFTGSARVGWSIVAQLKGGRYGRPVLAEMGGKNPTIVTASADLDAAAEGICRSAFGLSGQKCSACSRVVVMDEVHHELVDRILAFAESLKIGDPSEKSSFLGPVVDETAFERFGDAAQAASGQGKIILGGDTVDLPGYFVSPTVVIDLPNGHPLTRDELFLPFLTVTPVGSFTEAVAEANAVDFGLTAGIFAGDDQEIDRFLDEIEAGVVYVNRRAGSTTGAWPGIQSFCGWKASGSAGKGGLGPWYLQGFAREQSRTLVGR